jgi:hypothetical protein
VACSSSSSPPSSAQPPTPPVDDAGPPVVDAAAPQPDATDNGAPSDVYPAPHPAQPEVVPSGGRVVLHPKLVPVVFASDPLAADVDTLFAAFATTTYWGDMVAEYGIAKPVAQAPIHVTDTLPASVTDVDVGNFLAGKLDGTHPEFAAPDEDTFYVLIYPPGTAITLTGYGTSCKEFHGYHDEVALPSKLTVPYAVVSRCDSIPEAPVTGVQYVSAVMSHEILEGLADPFPFTGPAFQSTDDDHLAWMFITGGEIGDMCALQGDAFVTPADFPYSVQRMWSNAAAKAGHDPCIVQPKGEPYFNAAPVMPDAVSFTYDGQSGTTRGVKIPIGQSRTIELDLFSDGKTSAPFSVRALDPTGKNNLTFALDRSQGVNGEKLHLTITAVKQRDDIGGAEPFVLMSSLGARKNLWFGMVGQ